jgi:outer membrane protein assembly factor BamA
MSARRFAVTLAAVLLSGAAVLAQAPSPPAGRTKDYVEVEDVKVDGNRQVRAEQILSLLKTRPLRDYDPQVLKEDIARLSSSLHAFRNVRTDVVPGSDPHKVIVWLHVEEFPNRVKEIVYVGNDHMKPVDLDAVTGLRRDMPLNPSANQRACWQIVQRYYQDGRGLASCYLQEGSQPGDSRVVFNIAEGPIIRVRAIDFTGSTFVSDARLKTQLATSQEFLHLPIGAKYNPLMADQDVLTLEKYLKSFGFLDAKVNREVRFGPGQETVDIIFHIREGQRYKVSSVDVGGATAVTHEQEFAVLKTVSGEYFSGADTAIDKDRLTRLLGYRGYEAAVKEQLTWPAPGQVAVFYEVEQRPPAKVGQIYIVGNEVTKQNVILRQVPLYPGQVLSYPDLRVAETNLARLNIFEMDPEKGGPPKLEVIDNPNSEFKDVMIRVQETPTGSLLFGVGVNSDAGVTGSVVLNERNFDIARVPTSWDDFLSGRAFRGAGQEFRIEAVPSLGSLVSGAAPLQRYTVSWRDPFFLDSPYSLGISGYYYDRVFNEYTESRLGTRITVGRRLNKYWTVAGSVRVENVGVNSIPFGAPPDITNFEGNNFLTGFRASLTRDTRDSFMRPTQGSLLDFGVEEVVGDYNYPIFSAEYNKYFTVCQRADGSGRQVLAARSVLDIESNHTPVYDRFYAGGFQSMRGFEFRGVGPDIDGFKVGGFFMFLNSLEYQVPIKANDNIYLDFFIDSGTVNQTYNLDQYRVAAGFGIRVVVPMMGPVPIALDFGFPIWKADTDNTQVFSFWVGFFH